MQLKCKTSKDCDSGDVCDRKLKSCRESLRRPAQSKATLAKECLKKGIPIVYERNPVKGERKTRDALRNCKYQKDRTKVPYDSKHVKMLPAPAPVAFVRPPVADLQRMKKADLVKLYLDGQEKGFIDPSKSSDGLTNKQLARAISRATKKQW